MQFFSTFDRRMDNKDIFDNKEKTFVKLKLNKAKYFKAICFLLFGLIAFDAVLKLKRDSFNLVECQNMVLHKSFIIFMVFVCNLLLIHCAIQRNKVLKVILNCF